MCADMELFIRQRWTGQGLGVSQAAAAPAGQGVAHHHARQPQNAVLAFSTENVSLWRAHSWTGRLDALAPLDQERELGLEPLLARNRGWWRGRVVRHKPEIALPSIKVRL